MALGGPALSLAARAHRLDVVHDPTGVAPFTLGRWAGSYARIVTLHDAIGLKGADGYPLLHRALHRWFVPRMLPNVDAIVTVSEHARSELEDTLPADAPQVHVVPNGVGRQFQPVASDTADAAAKRYGLTRPYILTVSAFQARKNFGRLLAAFAAVRRDLPTHRLTIVGAAPWGRRELARLVREMDLAESVVLAGYVEEGDLPAVYSASDLFVFPSLYEGFGLPVLEAMACGTPVVASNATSIPEIAGDAAVLVDGTNIRAMSDAILRVATDPVLRASLLARGLARARLFSWDSAARKTLAIYRAALAGDSERAAVLPETKNEHT
jgi:glycosyltransferase involved in cell wall biosynthesis